MTTTPTALSMLPDSVQQIDLFGAAVPAPFTLPEAEVNDVGILVTHVLCRTFRAGRDYVEVRLGHHQGNYYTSVCLSLGTEYSGYAPGLHGRTAHPSFELAWTTVLEEARQRVRDMISVRRSSNEPARARQAAALLDLLNAGLFTEESPMARQKGLRQPSSTRPAGIPS